MANRKNLPISTKLLLTVDKAVTTFEDILMVGAYTIMTLVVVLGIVLRLIKVPNPYGEELSKYLMILAVYCGSAMCVRKRKHLGISFFVEVLPSTISKMIKILVDFLVCVGYTWISVLATQYALTGIRLPQLSPAMRMPIWIMYAIVAIGFILCAIHSISLFWSDYLTKTHPLDINDEGTALEGGDIS